MRSPTDRPASTSLISCLKLASAIVIALLLTLLVPFRIPHSVSKPLSVLRTQEGQHDQDPQPQQQGPPLNIVTLAFGVAGEDSRSALIIHNCLQLAKTRHHFEVHTDNVSNVFCSHCNCVRFKPRNCACPNPTKPACNHCEKLYFVIAQLKRLNELLFLDSDLIILKSTFLSHLYPRTRVHDALAAHGHLNLNASRYYSGFNSGLLFLRRLPGMDYNDMARLMYNDRKNGDQGIISRFVFQHYKNWDSLSLKWHCRFLNRVGYDIPLSECYTVHDRREGWAILKQLNYSLLRPA